MSVSTSSITIAKRKNKTNLLHAHAAAAGVQITPTPPATAREHVDQISRNQSRPKLMANFHRKGFRTEAAAALAATGMMPRHNKQAMLRVTKVDSRLSNKARGSQLGGSVGEDSASAGRSSVLGQSGAISLTQSGPIVLKAPPRPGEEYDEEDDDEGGEPIEGRKNLAVVERYLKRVTSSEQPAAAKRKHPKFRSRQSMESLHDFHMEHDGRMNLDITKMKFRDISNIWRNENPAVIRNALHGYYDYNAIKIPLDGRMARAGLMSAFEMGLINKMSYEIAISCKGLHRHQGNATLEVDPQCLMLRQRSVGYYDEWTEVLKTERVMNTIAPRFHKVIKFDCTDAELEQQLKFIIYDEQCPFGRQHRVGRNNTLGVMECKLWEVVEACRSGGFFTRSLKGYEDGIATSGYGGAFAHGVMILSVHATDAAKEKESSGIVPGLLREGSFEGMPQQVAGASEDQEEGGSGVPDAQTATGSTGLGSQTFGMASQTLSEALQSSRVALGLTLPRSTRGPSSEGLPDALVTEGGQAVVEYRPRVDRWMQHLKVQSIKLFDKFRDLAGHSVLAGVEGRRSSRNRALDLIEFLNLLAALGIVQLAQSKITAPSKPSPLGQLSKTEASDVFRNEVAKGGHEIDFQAFQRCMESIAKKMGQRVRTKYDTRPDSPLFPVPGQDDGGQDDVHSEIEMLSESESERDEAEEAVPWWVRLGRGHLTKESRNHAVHEACNTLLDMAASSRFTQVRKTAAPGVAALALTDQDVVRHYEGIAVMLELSQRAGNAKVKADCLDAVQQLVKAGGDTKKLVELGGLDWILRCRLSSSVQVRRKGLEVLAAVLVQGGTDVGDRWSDEVLKGLCLYAKNRDQRVAETASRLLLKLTRMAARHGELWEPLRAKAGPLAADVEHEDATGNDDDKEDGEDGEVEQSDDFGISDWTVNTTGDGNAGGAEQGEVEPEGRLNGIEMLLQLLEKSDIGQGGHAEAMKSQHDPLAPTPAMVSKRRRGNGATGGEFGERGWVCVGAILLASIWSILDQKDAYSLEVGSEALIRKGLGAVLASQMKRRSRSPVGEADLLALKCVCKLATLICGNALDVMPEEVVKQVVSGLQTQQQKPFASMTGAELKLLAERCKYEKYPKGTTLLSQGEHRRVMFIVIEGEVEVRVRLGGQGRAVEASTLKAGDSFGLNSMIIGEGSTATLDTCDDCVLVEMTFQVLNSVLVTRASLLEAARECRQHLIERSRIKFRARWAQGVPLELLSGTVNHEGLTPKSPASAPTKEALRVASRTAIHNVVWTLPHLKRFLEPTQGHLRAPALVHSAIVECHVLVCGIVLDCLRTQQAEAIFDAGMLPHLLQLVSSSSSQQVQRLAARALTQLSHSDSFNEKLAASAPLRPPSSPHKHHRPAVGASKDPSASAASPRLGPRQSSLGQRQPSAVSHQSNTSAAGPSSVKPSSPTGSPRRGDFGRTASTASSAASEMSVNIRRMNAAGGSGTSQLAPSFKATLPLAPEMIQALLWEFVHEQRAQPGAILEGFQKMSKEPPLLDILLRCEVLEAVRRRLKRLPVPPIVVLRSIRLGQELNKTAKGRALLAGVDDVKGDGGTFLDCLEDAVEGVGQTAFEGDGIGQRVLAAFEEFLAGLGETVGGPEGELPNASTNDFKSSSMQATVASDQVSGCVSEKEETFDRRASLMDEDVELEDEAGEGVGQADDSLFASDGLRKAQAQRKNPNDDIQHAEVVAPSKVEGQGEGGDDAMQQMPATRNRRIRSLVKAVGKTALRLLSGSEEKVVEGQDESSMQQGRDLLRSATHHKRSVISKFLAHAHEQAEQDWEANVAWLHGRKTRNTVDELLRWQSQCEAAVRKSFKSQLSAVYEDLTKRSTPHAASCNSHAMDQVQWPIVAEHSSGTISVSRPSSTFEGTPSAADDPPAPRPSSSSPLPHAEKAPTPSVPALPLPPREDLIAFDATTDPPRPQPHRLLRPASAGNGPSGGRASGAGAQVRGQRPLSARPSSATERGAPAGSARRRRPATARAPLARRMWGGEQGRGAEGGGEGGEGRAPEPPGGVVPAWVGPRPGGRVSMGTHWTRLSVRQWICEQAPALTRPDSRASPHLEVDFRL